MKELKALSGRTSGSLISRIPVSGEDSLKNRRRNILKRIPEQKL